MLRTECAANEGSHKEINEIGSESSKHAPCPTSGSTKLTTVPLGSGVGGATPGGNNASSSRSSTVILNHGENRSDDGTELDAHKCKVWPCPLCHKHRDADDEMTSEGQYSADAALQPTATTQTFFHPHEPLSVEIFESDDDLRPDIVTTSAAHGLNHKGHCS